MAVRILGEEWQLRCRQVGMLSFVVMIADSRMCRVQRTKSTMPGEVVMGAIDNLFCITGTPNIDRKSVV